MGTKVVDWERVADNVTIENFLVVVVVVAKLPDFDYFCYILSVS